MIDLEAIRARAAAAMPGPWGWSGYVPADPDRGHGTTRRLMLVTRHSGQRYVMDFQRWGFSGARPRFQDHERHIMIDDPKPCFRYKPYSGEVLGATHPDAVFIAAARQDVDDLLAEIDRLHEVMRLNAKAHLIDLQPVLVAGEPPF